uniref:Gypsy retrotransposon integrase-like protein 1 n=1 Tax=Iconisemion striatum TaxID=60296 RepID=A0A1A7Z3E0_9TELE
MEGKWEDVYNHLSSGSYPPECTRGQRQTLRKSASKFSLHDGKLFYGAEPRRRAIKSKEEAVSLFKEFHVPPVGRHTGIVKTRTSMCSVFYWHGMTADIEKWVSECDQCQRVETPVRVCKTPDYFKVSAVWEIISITMIGPLPKTSSGFEYILTATDCLSKWVEAFPQKTNSAEEVSKNLCTMFYRHGWPKRILTNQGQEFADEVNRRCCELLSVERMAITTNHAQTYRLSGRTNSNITRALRIFANERKDDWDIYLDPILFGLRSKMHCTTKVSPFLLMYGREARYPSEVPENVPLSSVMLPKEYRPFIKKQDTKHDAKE